MLTRTTIRLLSFLSRGLVLITCLALVGCDDSTPVPSAAPEDAAKSTLISALTSWEKGQSVDAMRQANPAITVSDPEWKSGQKLSKFEILGPGEPSGAERVFQVKLWLIDESGKESQEAVAYRVGTQPILTVFRALF
jgi:hypothetical protein